METANAAFDLLCDLQSALNAALIFLEGKERKGIMDGFLVFSSAHINRAAAGYIFLRRVPLLEASKLLVRPCIETMFRIHAVRSKPDLLYRIAYGEHRQDLNLVRPAATKTGEWAKYEAEDEKVWKDFQQAYAVQFPGHSMEDKKLKAEEAARAGGIEGYYDCAYRLYCQFTHGALRAATKSLRTDHLDDRTMAACVFCGLDTVAENGGSAPDLATLQSRLFTLP